MSQRRMVPRGLPEGSGLNPVGLSQREKARRRYNSQCRQWLACISATLTMVIVGTVYGWTTTSLVHLTSGTTDMPLTLTHDESSWIVSVTVLGSMFGSLVGAQLADRSGRKYCLLLCCTIFTLGWFIIYVTTSVPMLYLARVILGIGVGIAYTINPMYVSEVADTSIRGALGTLIAVNVFTGSLLTCILGLWLTYESLLVVLVIISFISFLSNTCYPETPYFLMRKGRKKQALKSIIYYKGMLDPHEMKRELRALRPRIRCKLQPQAKSDLPSQSRNNLPPQSRSDSLSQSTSDITLSSRSYFTSQSGSGFPSLSLREVQPDPIWEVVDTETMSDLHLPFRSDSHSRSISVIHSEVCEVHLQRTGQLCLQPSHDSFELPLQQSRHSHELNLQPSREFHPQSTSELHLPSTNEVHPPFTSEVPPPSTSEIQPGPRSEIQPEPTSEIYPRTRGELHSRSRGDLPSQSSVHFPSPCRNELRKQSSVDSRGTIGSNESYVDVTKQTWLTKLRVILQGNNRKALFIMLGLIMAQQLSGNFVTMQYLEVLFSKTTIGIKPNVATIIVLAVGLISGGLSTLTVESLGRRTLLIVSTLGSCFTLIILATYLLLVQHKFDVSLVSTLPVIDLIIYQIMYQIGLGTLPNVLLCEFFPTELKGFVGAIVVIFDGIIGFTVSKLYQVITDNVGSYSIYFIFATSCCLAFLMVFIWVPETKGKTYHEIEALLVGKNLNSLNEKVRRYKMDRT
ncbi:facilitated trehalose transporter Tret1 isoform X2 [Bombus terrestris]|uniref:Facilitated trehalose transporter Tret1 isoform X2 n=1 Tax=Bombus terrestris TaxID=30195 RepID=A0A9B0F5V6_BOMTE|nr:facilitated trehalose transporter Tret1 isoform X2 [Bombus terrestris]